MTIPQQAISPPKENLSKHGIQSVRQRVADLNKLGISIGHDEMKQKLEDYFCGSERMLSEEDIRFMEEIEKGYLALGF